MNNRAYINPLCEVYQLSSDELMSLTGQASILPGPGNDAPAVRHKQME